MDKPIAVGDLVMVITSCCSANAASARPFGIPWMVASISQADGECVHCGKNSTKTYAYSMNHFGNGCVRSPISWLKRIDPLSESESTETREELHA